MGTDGAALITRKKNYYFTDARYTEAAGRCIQNAQLRETGHGHGYADLLAEVVSSDHIGRMGFEDACMTVQEHARYQKALSCELVPATELLWKLRAQKDPEELEALTAAQRIAERALEDILNDIRPGITEKEIAARIQYRMLQSHCGVWAEWESSPRCALRKANSGGRVCHHGFWLRLSRLLLRYDPHRGSGSRDR